MSLRTPARWVGIDYGTQRVGIALADPLGMVAQPETTVPPHDLIEALEALDAKHGVEGVVVGWPYLHDGTPGTLAEEIQLRINALEKALPHVRIVRRDEYYTSELAKQALGEAGVLQAGRYDKGRVDAAAAALILQDYLDE